MGSAREVELLSAAGHLCRAAEDLRAIGLLMLADKLDSFITLLDVEMLLDEFRRPWHTM